MIASERNIYILQKINERGVVNLKDIAKELSISETTVRRDFEKLEKAGKLIRVQGGATFINGPEEVLDNLQKYNSTKQAASYRDYKLMARTAAEVVNDGDSVFIDIGQSLIPLAEILIQRKVHIVTNNTALFNITRNPVAELFLVGGQYQSEHNMLYGPITKKIMENFRFDHSFIGCYGVSVEHQMVYLQEVKSMEIKIASMSSSKKSHLIFDKTKLENNGFYKFAEILQFDTLFCSNYPTDIPKLPNLVTL